MIENKLSKEDKTLIIDVVKDDIIAFANVTLNGRPATIKGRLLKFPIIKTVDNELSTEFSWETVIKTVRENGGKFST